METIEDKSGNVMKTSPKMTMTQYLLWSFSDNYDENADITIVDESSCDGMPGVTHNAPVLPGASCGIYADEPLCTGFNHFDFYDE